MARIKITDLPVDKKISKEEMKQIEGGWSFASYYSAPKAGYDDGFGPMPGTKRGVGIVQKKPRVKKKVVAKKPAAKKKVSAKKR